MYIAVVPNRGSPPAILLREGYREGGQVKNRTLANLSKWPAQKIGACLKVGGTHDAHTVSSEVIRTES